MKTKVKLRINLVQWDLIPVNWEFSSPDLGIEHKRYYFLCFTLEMYKTKEVFKIREK